MCVLLTSSYFWLTKGLMFYFLGSYENIGLPLPPPCYHVFLDGIEA